MTATWTESRTRPKLLFLCHTLPYPLDGGVWIRSYHVLRLLSETFDVTALYFARSGAAGRSHDVREAMEALREFGAGEVFEVPQETSRRRWAWDHLRSVATSRPFTVYKHDSGPYRRRIAELLGRCRFDVVHLDSLDLSGLLPLPGNPPTVCVHHNVESELLRRRAAVESNPLRASYIRHQARLQEREEKRWCGRLDLNVAVSDLDATTLRRLVPGARVVVVPNGVDTRALRPGPESSRRGVVFVGGCSWFPNLDALHYFGSEILPRIRARRPGVEVSWVGQAEPEERHRLSRRYGVNVTGHVPDIEPYIQAAACYVVPLRVGGGTRLKVLDAWAYGKAVVTTSRGCEGLDARDGENALIRDDPAGFAAAVDRVLTDARLRDRLGRNARRTAEQQYDWRKIGSEMTGYYLSVIRPGSGRAGATGDADRSETPVRGGLI